jgi:phenylalanyl-tRNA synthetase alpha chain
MSSSIEQLDQIEREALVALDAIHSTDALQSWQGKYFGTKRLKGVFDEAMSMLGTLGKEERPAFGKRANEVKQAFLAAFDQKQKSLKEIELVASMEAGALDVTLPGTPITRGRLHPSTIGLRRILNIFAKMGFEVYRSPEIETDDYNFGLLNMPEEHPARDMWDTFYLNQPGMVLRTHTSPGQIRAMRELGENGSKPIRVILPGMVYRYEQVTARSEMQFNQVEGIAIGRNITLADLKGTFVEFVKHMYGGRTQLRFRASYFPFTEPSVEIDVFWGTETERDRMITKGTGWLEISGAGMIHPNVLRNGGYDPELWSGFAFGMGPERASMRLMGINDIRYFWQNDLRFLEQF